MSSSTIRHRKTSSEPASSPSHRLNATPIPPQLVPALMEQSGSRQVQVTSLSLTSLLTTLTTTEGITTTARKLYTYPTKRLSSSDLWKRYKADEEIVISNSTSGSSTPPPDYEEEALALTAQPGTAVVPVPISPLAVTAAPQEEDPSLVSAKFAMQGHNLLSLSLAEPANSSFRRHLYLDSITYLLRALPSDLSASETTQLISSLPPSLISDLQPSSAGGEKLERAVEHPTVHYLLQVMTATTVSSVRNLTPHLKSLAQSTWEYNLRYRVAERGYDKIRRTVDSGFAFWKAVAEWAMFEDCDRIMEIDGEGAVVASGRRLRYGGGIVRDVGMYAGGVIRSGVGGVIEGFVEGMRS
ncbi:hypothetical protein H072_7773 [Dactylellina haptotyla CBS 200.50]|uniref:Uncharacterized protein n=1 Tax=Dactylellina haptotyla (strain CBS 200.50) TaxID=1284197 RepID=S8A646_DACHA|nr:hypothetical protein H072_7773 [Dactylellina haptotyla CBS 200.50]